MRRRHILFLFFLLTSLTLILFFINSKKAYTIQHYDFVQIGKNKHLSRKSNIIQKSVVMKNAYTDELTVFSAFSTSNERITVIIPSYGYYMQKIYCRYYDQSGNDLYIAFESKVFPDMVITCKDNPSASFIGLSINANDKLGKSTLRRIERHQKEEHYFSVCLAPLYGPEPKWLMFIEFIEYYRIQGASHFYIYEFDLDSILVDIVEYYKELNLIEIIPMRENTKCLSRHRCRHEMQLQECVARSRNHSSWIALVDLDERLHVLQENQTLEKWLRINEKANIVEFRFRCRWILREKETSQIANLDEASVYEELPTIKYHNTSHVAPLNHTTKGIVNPKLVNSQGVHQVLSFMKDSTINLVPPETGVVRHYRLQRGWSFFLKEAETFGSFENTSLPKPLEDTLKSAVWTTIKGLKKRKKFMTI